MIPNNSIVLRRSRLAFAAGVFLLILVTALLTRQCNALERQELLRVKKIVAAHEHRVNLSNQIAHKLEIFLNLSRALDSLTLSYATAGANTMLQEALRSKYRDVESHMGQNIRELQHIYNLMQDSSRLATDVIGVAKYLKTVRVAYAFDQAKYADVVGENQNIETLREQLYEAQAEVLGLKADLTACGGDKAKTEMEARREEMKYAIEVQRLYGNIDYLVAYLRARNAQNNGLNSAQATEVQSRLETLKGFHRARP